MYPEVPRQGRQGHRDRAWRLASNQNDSREDCGWENIWKGNVQMRPCAMGHSWKKELYAETRLLHPMKRVGEKGAGKGYFVPISWEEALDTIAERR